MPFGESVSRRRATAREARGGCESTSVWCAVLPREAELQYQTLSHS
ncbi:unnamed protein product [Fusarium venenatum]|uniref:Uncharacterized protein n=1 Tax=Fusarium venenatum TaxID=56646 RepID=A0A2L2T3H5_9HYPO|nr:uncharacterized protein FVRRES_00611 [Fusarium venenatum]CEI64099.1 unnamed protein product [Fusarium venenatum]